MLKHYLKIAFRNLTRNKVFSVINILGLTVGMGVCLLIYQYIHFEMSFDDFHEKGERVYRVVSAVYQNEEKIGHGVESPYMMGLKAKEEIPEITDAIRVHPQYGAAVVVNPETNQRFIELGMLYVDQTFLEVFDYQLKIGQANSVLSKANNIVLTEDMAIKYFGSTNPIGQVLKISGEWDEASYVVTGVVNSPPANSHIDFDALIPMQSLLENDQYKSSDGWSWNNFATYVILSVGADVTATTEKLRQLYMDVKKEDYEISNTSLEMVFQPIQDIHLNSDGLNDPITKNEGSLENVKIYTVVALFILFIAWINYINLTTAQAMRRAREVGVRKAIGANRNQLTRQFLLESALTNFISASLALGVAYALLPMLNDMLGLALEFTLLADFKFCFSFLLILILGVFISGAYPAFMLSSYKTVRVLKDSGIPNTKNLGLRRALIVFQFAASVLLIAGALLVYSQIEFMKNADHGMAMDKILVMTGPKVGINKESIKPKLQTFKNRLKEDNSVIDVTGSENIPSRGYNWGTTMRKLGATEQESETTKIVFVDHDFLKAYDIEMVAGEPFPKERKFSRRVMINEATLDAFGIESPEDALLQKFIIQSEDTIEVAGVLKNYNWSSLKEKHEPYCFVLFGEALDYFSVKIDMSNVQSTVSHVEDVFREVFPNDAFEYFFLEDEFNRQYQSDLQFGKLVGIFTILAIFIACLGLFALVSFSATLRMKEIGIRKVLGAKIGHLMMLLSKEYLYLLLIANVLALPAVWYWGSDWLNNYAFKIDMNIDLFVIPGLMLLVISTFTVSYQTFSTAKANPVDSLRSE